MAKRQNLTIASADQGLAKAAEALGLPCQLIADQVVSRLLRDALSGEGDRVEAGSVLVAGFRPFGAANPKLVTNEQIDQLRDHCLLGSRASDAQGRPPLDGAGT